MWCYQEFLLGYCAEGRRDGSPQVRFRGEASVWYLAEAVWRHCWHSLFWLQKRSKFENFAHYLDNLIKFPRDSWPVCFRVGTRRHFGGLSLLAHAWGRGRHWLLGLQFELSQCNSRIPAIFKDIEWLIHGILYMKMLWSPRLTTILKESLGKLFERKCCCELWDDNCGEWWLSVQSVVSLQAVGFLQWTIVDDDYDALCPVATCSFEFVNYTSANDCWFLWCCKQVSTQINK